MPRERLVNKKLKKVVDGRCHFCPCDDYALLDLHRIREGKDYNPYSDFNTLTVCVACHRKIHTGSIQILGKHLSTSGSYVVIYIEDGVEKIA